MVRERTQACSDRISGNALEVQDVFRLAAALDVKRIASDPTPRRIFLDDAARERFASLGNVRDDGASGVPAIFAYSTKTNPDPRLLTLAETHGWSAETISPAEVAHVRRLGFGPARTIYNGPLDAPAGERFAYRFADSIEAYAAAPAAHADVVGVRLRPAMVRSRFGVPVEDDDRLVQAVRDRGAATIALSMHVPRNQLHGASWRDACEDLFRRGRALREATGVRVVAFDGGGGWDPSAPDDELAADVRWLREHAASAFGDVQAVIVEPGQALLSGMCALAVRVTEVRHRAGRSEAVIDAGYEDWPDQHGFIHPIFVARGAQWAPLGRGGDRLLGATCLEYDLIEGLRFPADLVAGDLLMIAGVGGYDTSMAFAFAHGVEARTTVSA